MFSQFRESMRTGSLTRFIDQDLEEGYDIDKTILAACLPYGVSIDTWRRCYRALHGDNE